MRGADHINGGLETGRAGIEQQLSCDGLAAFEGVHAVEQHEVAEVQDTGVGLAKGAMLEVEMGVGAAAMEEGATSGGLHGHRVGVGRWVVLAEVQHADVDPVVLAVALDPLAIGVVADEPAGGERELDLHRREVLEDVIRAAAVGTRFAQDAREHVLSGVAIDDLDVIDDEIAGGKNALAGSFWHEKFRARRPCLGPATAGRRRRSRGWRRLRREWRNRSGR